MAENKYLIKNPVLVDGWEGTYLRAVTLYGFNVDSVDYGLVPSSSAESLWCIGFIANVPTSGNPLVADGTPNAQPIVLSNVKGDATVYCDHNTTYDSGYSDINELVYGGKTYYYSGKNLYPMGFDSSAIINNLIPVYTGETFPDHETAALKLIELYKAEGGLMPGERYPTSWVRKLVNGVWQKTFAFAHIKTVYTDYANKKTLADKLSEIDTEIGNKAESGEIPTKVSQLDNDSKYQTETQVKSTISSEVAKIVADAPEDYDTLKEISDWISGHENDASAMNSAIKANTKAIEGKVDKVDGKGLSANDYTTAEKTKLAGIDVGANKTVVDDSLSGTSTNPVQNKVVKAGIDALESEIAQQSTEMMDIKMLGWSVPRECPVQNEINGNQFVQKVGRVDLGKLKWDYQAGYTRFLTTDIPNKKLSPGTRIESNLYLNGYMVISDGRSIESVADKSIYSTNNKEVAIHDSTYTDVDTFKSAMQGQYLYYELATPIITTIDGNEIGEGVSDVRKETTVNLLKPTLQTTTLDGVTYTNNGDGTYTLNGTPSTSSKYSGLRLLQNVIKNIYGGCLFTGTSLSTNEYRLYVGYYDNNGRWVAEKFVGKEGVIIDGSYPQIIFEILCNKGASAANNLVFKPMITTNLNATYDDFVPYTGDTGSLNGDVADLRSDVEDFNKKVTTKRILLTTGIENDYYRYIKPILGSNEIYTPPIVVDESEESDDSSAAGDTHSYAWRSQTIMDILDLENPSGITKDGITVTYHASRPSSGKKLYTVKGTATSDTEIPLYSVSNPKDAPLYFTSNHLTNKMSESTFYVKVSDTTGEQIIMGSGRDVSRKITTHTGKVTVSLVVKSGTVIRSSVINIKCGYSKMGYVADYSPAKYSDEVDSVIDAILDLDSRLKVLENK